MDAQTGSSAGTVILPISFMINSSKWQEFSDPFTYLSCQVKTRGCVSENLRRLVESGGPLALRAGMQTTEVDKHVYPLRYSTDT